MTFPDRSKAAWPRGLAKRKCTRHAALTHGSSSAVSKQNFASKYAFKSSRRDLHNALLCTALQSHFFGKILCKILLNFAKFSKISEKFRKISQNFGKFQQMFRKKCDFRAVQRSALCRSRRELSNAYLLAKFGFDTAENKPSKVCRIP